MTLNSCEYENRDVWLYYGGALTHWQLSINEVAISRARLILRWVTALVSNVNAKLQILSSKRFKSSISIIDPNVKSNSKSLAHASTHNSFFAFGSRLGWTKHAHM